ncbi:MAG: response regulator [Thermodesulfovibrionales bacterium]
MTVEPKRILVIDDEADIMDVVSAYARELGFEADSAQSGGEAVDKAKNIDYHAIFCDYRMPGLNGLAIYKLIISKKPAIKGRFIMTTGADLEKDIEGILKREGIPILRKPFRLKSIKELIFSLEER